MEHRTEAVAAAHAGQATARRDGEALTPSRIPVADTRHARGARQLSVDAPPAPERAASAELKLYRSVWLPCVIKELHAAEAEVIEHNPAEPERRQAEAKALVARLRSTLDCVQQQTADAKAAARVAADKQARFEAALGRNAHPALLLRLAARGILTQRAAAALHQWHACALALSRSAAVSKSSRELEESAMDEGRWAQAVASRDSARRQAALAQLQAHAHARARRELEKRQREFLQRSELGGANREAALKESLERALALADERAREGSLRADEHLRRVEEAAQRAATLEESLAEMRTAMLGEQSARLEAESAREQAEALREEAEGRCDEAESARAHAEAACAEAARALAAAREERAHIQTEAVIQVERLRAASAADKEAAVRVAEAVGAEDARAEANARIADAEAHATERIADAEAHATERIAKAEAHATGRIANADAHATERIAKAEAEAEVCTRQSLSQRGHAALLLLLGARGCGRLRVSAALHQWRAAAAALASTATAHTAAEEASALLAATHGKLAKLRARVQHDSEVRAGDRAEELEGAQKAMQLAQRKLHDESERRLALATELRVAQQQCKSAQQQGERLRKQLTVMTTRAEEAEEGARLEAARRGDETALKSALARAERAEKAISTVEIEKAELEHALAERQREVAERQREVAERQREVAELKREFGAAVSGWEEMVDRGNAELRAELRAAVELSEQRSQQLERARRELVHCEAATASHERAALQARDDERAVRTELGACGRVAAHERDRAAVAEGQLVQIEARASAADTALREARQEMLRVRMRAETAEKQLACLLQHEAEEDKQMAVPVCLLPPDSPAEEGYVIR